MGKHGVTHTARTGVNRAIGSNSGEDGLKKIHLSTTGSIYVASVATRLRLMKLRSTILGREEQTTSSAPATSSQPTGYATTKKAPNTGNQKLVHSSRNFYD